MSHSGPKEELLGLLPLKGQKRGEGIANAVIECMDKHHFPLDKIVSISTDGTKSMSKVRKGTATAGSDVVQSGRPIFDDFFQHLWPYIGNNTANVVFQMVKRLWLIRIDQ
ncbi:dimer_Tnp_hAT domain-containing protein [Trichonephila clavipes]|nr:dimer_Tnp_hAT domain-containing protein [Trichonephila clavipes]